VIERIATLFELVLDYLPVWRRHHVGMILAVRSADNPRAATWYALCAGPRAQTNGISAAIRRGRWSARPARVVASASRAKERALDAMDAALLLFDSESAITSIRSTFWRREFLERLRETRSAMQDRAAR
jgi:hypothetical protein